MTRDKIELTLRLLCNKISSEMEIAARFKLFILFTLITSFTLLTLHTLLILLLPPKLFTLLTPFKQLWSKKAIIRHG